MTSILNTINRCQLFSKCLKQSFDLMKVPSRNAGPMRIPRKRHPEWLPKPKHVPYNEGLTQENKEFISDVVLTTKGLLNSPLNTTLIPTATEWTEGSKRTGLVGKKIGQYPLWLKNGKRVIATLIQIVDNEVVKYIPPEEFNPVIRTRRPTIKVKKGCLIVGAQNVDPQLLTKEYYGIFDKAGIQPKRMLMRFMISPNAVLQPGTPLFATHFKPGDYIDIRAKTVDRGFQGVMKRWGFHGMPASHGATKTHRRPGNIGVPKARVMPGTKMPGHMGNRWRMLRGIKILRINTKYNVIWVMAPNVPGELNCPCYLYDTLLPNKKNTSPHFPTFFPSKDETELSENLYADDVHPFDAPTIEFTSES